MSRWLILIVAHLEEVYLRRWWWFVNKGVEEARYSIKVLITGQNNFEVGEAIWFGWGTQLFVHVLQLLRCSHIWAVMSFGTHPETFYHVINPTGFWKSHSVFKHVESQEFWLEQSNGDRSLPLTRMGYCQWSAWEKTISETIRCFFYLNTVEMRWTTRD